MELKNKVIGFAMTGSFCAAKMIQFNFADNAIEMGARGCRF